jgi:DNA-binding Lrp family transcriptional regulator
MTPQIRLTDKKRSAMNRGYTFLWRKTWTNPVFREKGKKFSRIEAWLHLTNVLATGIDDPGAGLQRGEFRASIRRLASLWNWSPTAAFRFLRQLEENHMISRLKHQPEHLAEQEAERFTVCNYSTYNPERNTKRNSERNAQRNTIKEGIKEGINELEKDTHQPAGAGACVSPKILHEIYRQQNQSLPEVKALTAERLRKCRSRIDQAARDGWRCGMGRNSGQIAAIERSTLAISGLAPRTAATPAHSSKHWVRTALALLIRL